MGQLTRVPDEESHSPPWSPVTTGEGVGACRTPWCDVETAGAFAQVVEFEIDHLAQAVWRPVGGVDERLERHALDEREQAPSFCRWIRRRLDSSVGDISFDEAGDALDCGGRSGSPDLGELLVSDRHALVNEPDLPLDEGLVVQW